jgi:hypothetical protein
MDAGSFTVNHPFILLLSIIAETINNKSQKEDGINPMNGKGL